MSSRILVEGDSDKKFFEAFISHIGSATEVDSPVCSTDKCELMDGKDDLKRKLESIKREAKKHDIDKVGIILDANSVGVEKREQEIKERVLEVFGVNPEIVFLSHIVNIDGKGELESLQKVIKSQESLYADCLNSFQNCLPKHRKISQKEFDKLWIYNYEKHDCNSAELNKMYDFNHASLINLKGFLGHL